MRSLLKTYFGYDTFRPYQEEIIQNVLDKKDTLVLMPTGGGKSLCYQLPALKFTGLTLVISPLISLMKDQVDSLNANGISAAYLNSALSFQESEKVIASLKQNKIKILYVAPERFSSSGFQELLKKLNVSFVAVDEAHCISQWGHDFRPDYRNLRQLKKIFPKIPLIALTATATEKVRADIVQQLELKSPKVFLSSFDRPNLHIKVVRKKNALDKLFDLLEKHKGQSAIIYCFSRKDTEEISETLNQNGFKSLCYHAGLVPESRKFAQEQFIKDEISIIVATIAFGMGIDKPDVRLVVHYSFPKTLESYYQEIGRAGRDGLPSQCVMFYSYGDKRKHDFFINQIEDPNRQLKEALKLQEVIDFCELNTCRRERLLSYFGEKAETKCQNCDVCLRGREVFDATELAQKILSAVIKTGNCFGKNHVVNVLRGANTQKIWNKFHDQLSVYGISKNDSKDLLIYVFQQLYQLNFLKKNEGEYSIFSITKKGFEFLKNKKTLELQKIPIDEFEEQEIQIDYNSELFEILRFIRKNLADKKGVPPFVIFGDRTLQEIATYFPQDKENFEKISGVGARKLEEYGDIIISAVKDFCSENKISPKKIPGRFRKQNRRKRAIKTDRYEQTKKMLDDKYSLSAIAKSQNFKEGTIVNHIQRLLDSGEKLDIDYLKPENKTYQKVCRAINACGAEALRPIFEFLNEKVDYDTIRLVMMFEKNRELIK